MNNLRQIELKLVMDLFESSPGYVLDFSNRSFDEFFRDEVGIDINDQAYLGLGTSKGKRFRAFLQVGQRIAVAKALATLWEYRESNRQRSGQASTPDSERVALSAVVERLGGGPLLAVGEEATNSSPREGPLPAVLENLEHEFAGLHSMERQARGYAFEKFLKHLIDAWNLRARSSFRLAAEQIDGSFQHDGATYLVEAKWQDGATDLSTLRAFQGMIEDRPEASSLATRAIARLPSTHSYRVG